MNNETAEPLPPLRTRLLVFVFGMLSAAGLAMSAFMKQPNLLFLGEFGKILFLAMIPMAIFVQLNDVTKAARGVHLALLTWCILVAAVLGYKIYEDWPHWVVAWNALAR